MAKRETKPAARAPSVDRRHFLGTGAALSFGAGGLLASLGLSGCATKPGAESTAAPSSSLSAAALTTTTPPAVTEAAKLVTQVTATA